MNMVLQKSAAESAYLEAFAGLPAALRNGARKSAYEQFAAIGLPHRRLEDWKWTDLRQIIDRPYPPLADGVTGPGEAARLVARSPFGGVARARLVFVNGRYDEALSSLPASGDVKARALDGSKLPAIDTDDPIAALNTVFTTDGAHIAVRKGGNLDAPIELLFLTVPDTPATLTTRNVIELEDGASATLIETHLGGEGAYVANSVTQARLGEGARLDRVKVQEDGAEGIHLANFHATLGPRAVLRDFTLIAGAKATRQQGFVTFAGEGGDARIGGSYLLSGKQHADTRLLVDHAMPHCTSRELFKCVMDENARGVFQGKVIVRPHAQKTDGKQSSHGLLLSPAAEFDTKPELEIYADDVICGHGATSGEPDEDQLFYLKARGIPDAEAKSLLIAAFAAEAIDTVENEAVREVLTGIAEGWLKRRKAD